MSLKNLITKCNGNQQLALKINTVMQIKEARSVDGLVEALKSIRDSVDLELIPILIKKIEELSPSYIELQKIQNNPLIEGFLNDKVMEMMLGKVKTMGELLLVYELGGKTSKFESIMITILDGWKATFAQWFNVWTEAAANSLLQKVAIDRLKDRGKSFDDWKSIYNRTADKSEFGSFVYNMMKQTAKEYTDWSYIYDTQDDPGLEKIAIHKMAELVEDFEACDGTLEVLDEYPELYDMVLNKMFDAVEDVNQWIIAWDYRKDDSSLQDKALSILDKVAKTFEDWLIIYNTYPSGPQFNNQLRIKALEHLAALADS